MSGPTSDARRAAVTGIGLLSPLGDEPAAFWNALLNAEDGFSEVDLFDTSAMSVCQGAQIRFNPRDYVGRRNVRPLDRTGQLAVIAAQKALEASGWDEAAREETPVGLVLGTMFGSVATIAGFDRRAVEAGPKYAKPFEFANSVINAAAGQTAIWHHLWGVNSTVAGGPAAGVQALGYALDLIRHDRAPALLAGGAEELCFESFFGFHQAGGLCGSPTATGGDRAVPLEARRGGFRLGEGAAFLALEEKAAAERRGASVWGEILGHGSAFDCSRGSDPSAAATAVERAVGLALADAGVAPAEIAAVSVSANGSPAGDRHEAVGLGRALAGHAAALPVLALKGQVGECLGASGAFQAVALLLALEHGRAPGIVGLEQLAKDCPLTAASAAESKIEGDYGLVHALGFDGTASAVVVRRGS